MTQPTAMNCKGIPNEGTCNNKAKQDGYCHLHYTRGSLLEQAKLKGVRICDDAKRACKNETFNGKLKCEDCLRKTRERDMKQYEERKANKCCVTCGIKLQEEFKGIKGTPVFKCNECYEKERKIEQNRTRVPRNEKSEKKSNLQAYYNKYTSGASDRNLEFNLSFEKFRELVESPCNYCKKFNEFEVVGIDRIDSNIGYIEINTVSCCETCNYMKGTQNILEFARNIVKLYTTFAKPFLEEEKDKELLNQEASPSRRLRPTEIINLYLNRQLQKYIELCIHDKRLQTYIDKLVEATKYTMTKDEFTLYLKKIARSEVRTNTEIPIEERQRVPRNEIKALLGAKKVLDAVKIYEAQWGYTKSIREDFADLSEQWVTLPMEKKEECLQNLFTKYGNRRSYAKRVKENSETSSTTESVEEIDTTPIPIEATPFTSTEPILETKPPEPLPTQWKVSNIYTYLTTGKEDIYKNYVKENNPGLTNESFNTFLTKVKEGTKEDAEKLIKEFVVSLRTLRHNALCKTKNDEVRFREDKQVWDSADILVLLKQNKIHLFKERTESFTQTSPEDPKWCKRWDEFLQSLREEESEQSQKGLISKFLAAQRAKRQRRKA
jgi:hypothetical protein